MSDLISRQDAITLPVMPKEHREYQTYNLDDAYEQGWFDCQKSIEELPSAQRTGEWVDFSMSIKGVPTEACGVCGEWSLGRGKNYCPNCGAKMKGR